MTVRILGLTPVRGLPQVEVSSVGEAWFRILTAVGLERPDLYVAKLAAQVRANRDRKEAEQRISGRRRFVGLRPPKRRFKAGGPNPGWEELSVPDSLPAPGNSVLKEIERRDNFRTLTEEIGRLPPDDQSLVLQCYWHGRSQSDIARERGESPSAVRSRLDRIRDRLRDGLIQRWGGEPCFE